tara:strand:- start:106 stop:549 length:444 start_codon:yes stop_codon:yes gene_type:complete
MASLLSPTEISGITGIFNDIFDTFKRDVVVYKEPKKVISQINTDSIFGYGEAADAVNYSYVPQSGTYSAKIKYIERASDDPYVMQFQSDIETSLVRIKVKDDARKYINTGKTEKVEFDGKSFSVRGNEVIKNFLGSEFYVFYLEEVS